MDTDVPTVDTGQQQQQHHFNKESCDSSADQVQQQRKQQQADTAVVEEGDIMTPEEGSETAVIADLQQQMRVPERPSSSSRTPCPKFSKKCDSCGQEFHTTNHYLEHVCDTGLSDNGGSSRPCSVPTSHFPMGVGGIMHATQLTCNELSDSSASDVENFTGKIVYNKDGSAIIMDGDSELSDDEDDLLTRVTVPTSSQQLIPHMVNALHIARNPALYNALYGQAYSFLQEKNKVPDVPVMHSFRVFTVRDVASETTVTTTSNKLDEDGSQKRPSSVNKANFPMVDYSSVPIKPILMCFLCKLSFGYAKSFVAHAMGEHNINLNDEEKSIMSQKNTSAIIQGVGKDKEPLLSFLEPIPSSLAQNIAGSQSGGVYAQSLQSSCTSSFGSSDPMTNLLNAVSSAVAGSYGSSAITTLVSAVSSPVAALSEIKPSVSNNRAETRTTPALSSSLLSADSDEALAPELQDLVTIERLAKAAAAAAEAERASSLSPRERKSTCYNGQNNSDMSQEDQDLRLNPFDFSPHPTLSTAASVGSLDRPTSAGSHESMSPGMSRVSPKSNPIPSPLLSRVPSPSPTTSSPVCICPQHPDGRVNGVECPKCDLILGSSRSLGGHMTMMHSRNSCKTLKCPKCNWHYKYQETLEIHMKEKHPENDMSCIYCLTNQSHPRLARGETYTCGYKPYRCEVCNYSTTTKGNLSIHMQSDKHINNVQELQNGTLQTEHVMNPQALQPPPPMPTPPASEAAKKPVATSKPKATWRCDVCNYETNVARNLRIHMTSEKHNHNMMVLQQNVKHMQQISAFQQAQAQAQAQAMDPMFQFHPGLLLPCDSQLQPEAALADMAYNHALLMMATQQQQQRAMAAAAAAAAAASGKSPMGAPLNLSVPPTLDIDHPDPSLRPDVPYDENGKLFQCCVCHVYSADTIESLNQHAQMDRTRQREEEVLMIVAGTYICKLCTYKTNLKANFQLHCKTDKHLQRLQHVNHVKEGGASTEWKLKYANVSNPVQVRCNACDYYTNSIHKLQLHNANPRHEANSRIFAHLQLGAHSIKAEAHYFQCRLCNFSTKAKFNMIQHIHSMRHMRNENFRQMQLRSEGREGEEDVRDYIHVKELKGNEKIIFDADVDTPVIDFTGEEPTKSEGKATPPKTDDKQSSDSRLKQALEQTKSSPSSETASNPDHSHRCPFCNYSSNSEVRIQMHVVSQHVQQVNTIPCPLCQEGCKDLTTLENHLIDVHNVTKEGVQRLLLMVDMSAIEKANQQKAKEEESTANKPENVDQEAGKNTPENKERTLDDVTEDMTCSFCNKLFFNVDDLFTHQNEYGHMDLKPTPSGLEYQCWKKGCMQFFKTITAVQMHFKEVHSKKPLLAVSDRHVYKYRCNQCSLAFKTLEKLQLHSQYHMIRAATKCVLCGRSFRSVIALQKHVETSHTDMTKEQLEQYKASLANNPLLASGGGGVLDPQTTELLKKESIREEMEINEELMDTGAEKESSPSYEMECDHSDLGESLLAEGTGSNQDILEDYINSQSMAEDSYNDPNRKYKCHRCKVAFTRQSYLTSHNKTLLHRKGEKMSYPMEKYLDPNRPFKCEICMESFTQKNILLVHYNSVSHLHKVKLSMKESSNSTTSVSSTSVTNTSVPSTAIFTAPCSSPNLCTPPNSSISSDTEKKPFKCNICKVAYSQASTLDIHIRSVLHQTRASKLHELAMTGQIDLSVPLIERSEQTSNEQLHSQLQQTPTMSNESSSLMLPQTSPATSVPSSVQAPKIPDLTQVPLSTPASSAAATITSASPQLHLSTDAAASVAQALGPQPPVLMPSQVSSQALTNCSRCNAVFMSHDALIQHQQLCSLFNPPHSQASMGRSTPVTTSAAPTSVSLPNMNSTNQLSSMRVNNSEKDELHKQHLIFQQNLESTNATPPQLSPQINQGANQLPIRPKCPFPRPRPLVYKHLIESFGFDVVMQFNENNQRRRKAERKEADDNQNKDNHTNSIEMLKGEIKTEDIKVISIDEEPKTENEIKKEIPDLPEINRSVCNICSKEFTSVWVLKTHKEEIHKEIVPFEFLEKFAESFRLDYEKRNADQLLLPASCEENLNDTNPQTPSVTSETPLCATPSSVSSTNQQINSSASPSTSVPSQMPDVSSSVTANQMAAQLQFNQLLMSMGLGMGLPMGMNLNMPFAAAAAMNLHPPLIPVLLPPPMDPLMASAFNHPMMPGGVESSYFAQQKMMHQQQSAAAAAAAQAQQQKRARTRINDEQLKILRTYFDINNSPTEEQLIEMSEKSGLPLKVIKHWFRNTLFKERQRNKDSPYNFNNPPSTFLNLEEYEKTGEAKVIPINRADYLSKIDADSTNQSEDGRSLADDTDSSQEDKEKHDTDYHSSMHEDKLIIPRTETPSISSAATSSTALTHPTLSTVDMLSASVKEDMSKDLHIMHSESSSPSPQPSINFSSVSSISGPMIPTASASPPTSDSPRGFNSPSFCGSSSAGGGTGSGKRANRTRFTDYQIKVLQEFFETNAYPKDDDLEYLSKLLSLSPRVIVVWFQNARQKARKVYENQPPINTDDDSAGKFQRTPGLNYQCKKCLQVFQRYYELIKHQKSSCFKDENPIAVQMKAAAAVMEEKSQSQSSSVPDPSSITNRTSDKFVQNGTYRCDKCSLSFPRFDLWREHQIVHIMNPNLFPNYSPNSSFGILQYEAQQPPTPPLKRKLSEEEEQLKECGDQPKDKRLRTTILPEQLDYLYQKYQIESNPSRKMLENIAREVGLKKRVVQVWFQNTRARERKGQFRAHQQVIHKRCPFCRALFKARSALESHLATRHADQYTRGDINIDSLPDGEMDSNPETPSTSNASEDVKNSMFPSFSSCTTTTSSAATSFTAQNLDSVQNSMKKYYEDSLKKYLDELSNASNIEKERSTVPVADLSVKQTKPPSDKPPGHGGDIPLDLSKPVRVNIDGEKSSDGAPTNLSDKSSEDAMNRSYISCDDVCSETHSESTENMDFDDHLDMSHESNPTSPSNAGHLGAGKRFRTQMSTIQLKVMKSIFADYKTPSMAECETLGREIALPKRVIQVWFQNARAKEKKAKLAFLKAFGHEMDMQKLPEECTICKVKYNVKFSNTSMQDHIFSRRHLDSLKAHITQIKKLTEGQENIDRLDHSPATPSSVLNQLVQSQHSLHQDDSDILGSSTASSGGNPSSLMQQLHMIGLQQMPGMPMSMGMQNYPNASNGPANLMGVGAAGSPPTSMPSVNTPVSRADAKVSPGSNKCNNTSANTGESTEKSADTQPPTATTSTANQVTLQRKDESKKDVSDSINGSSNNNATSVHPPSQRAGNMADFPNPTSEAGGLFPYMYAGFPGYYAGLSGAFFHPGMYPGRNKL